MAVIPLTAALIACRKWVGVCILLSMVSRGTPWRRLWQLQWFLWFMLSMVCLSDLKMHFGWGKRWRKCVTSYKRGVGGKTDPEEGGFHAQLCYTSPGWVWPSHFIFLQVSVLEKWNKDIDLNCFETYSDKIISKTMGGIYMVGWELYPFLGK